MSNIKSPIVLLKQAILARDWKLVIEAYENLTGDNLDAAFKEPEMVFDTETNVLIPNKKKRGRKPKSKPKATKIDKPTSQKNRRVANEFILNPNKEDKEKSRNLYIGPRPNLFNPDDYKSVQSDKKDVSVRNALKKGKLTKSARKEAVAKVSIVCDLCRQEFELFPSQVLKSEESGWLCNSCAKKGHVTKRPVTRN